jgi:hypothetical protein
MCEWLHFIVQQNVSVRNFLSDECRHMQTRLLSCTTVGGNGPGCGVSTQLRSDSTFLETSHALGLFTIRWFYSQFCRFPPCIIQVHMIVNTCGSKVKRQKNIKNSTNSKTGGLANWNSSESELSEKEISQITGQRTNHKWCNNKMKWMASEWTVILAVDVPKARVWRSLYKKRQMLSFFSGLA